MKDRPDRYLAKLKTGEKVELVFGEPAASELISSPDVLMKFIRLQVDETYEPPVLFHENDVGWVKRILLDMVKKLSFSSSKIISTYYRKIMTYFFPNGWFFGWSKQDELDWAWNDATRLLKQHNFAVAKIAGKIVSIAAFKLGGEMEDKAQVFELTKFVTLPEYRGRGIYSLLRDEMIQRIQNRFPESPLMTFTKSRAVIRRCQETGWRPLSLDVYSEMTKRVGRSGLAPEDKAALHHWRSFILEPLRANQQNGKGGH